MRSTTIRSMLVLFTMILLILPIVSLGQQFSLKDGSKSLQFRVVSDFSLTALDGVSFSGKWHLSNLRALRLGLGVSGNFGDSDKDSYREDPYLAYIEKTYYTDDTKYNSQTIDLTSYYVFYSPVKHRTSLYYGLGPALSFDRDHSSIITTRKVEADFYGDSTYVRDWDSSSSKRTEKTFGAGLGNVIGVEVFATENISFTAEYGIDLMYTWINKVVETYSYEHGDYIPTQKENNNTFNLSYKPVKLGISVYF